MVSIITPAYRAASYIEETVRSVQVQDIENWELLIVDDCSPDDSYTVIESYALHDSRIKLLRQEKNSGPALARQRALDMAQGRFIAFLDSDDYWLPGKLSRQLAFMQERDATISYTMFRRISEDNSRIGHLITIPDQLNYSQLLKNTAIATSTVIVDREKTGPLTMQHTYYDDYALWLDILKRGFVAYGLQQDLMRYRVLGKSVSRNKGRSAYWVWRIYRDIERMGRVKSTWCFANYAAHAWLKYRRF